MSSTLAAKMEVQYVGHAEVTPEEKREALKNIRRAWKGIKKLYGFETAESKLMKTKLR